MMTQLSFLRPAKGPDVLWAQSLLPAQRPWALAAMAAEPRTAWRPGPGGAAAALLPPLRPWALRALAAEPRTAWRPRRRPRRRADRRGQGPTIFELGQRARRELAEEMYPLALEWARAYAARHRPGDEGFLTECLSAAGEALWLAAAEMSPLGGRLTAYVRQRVLWRLCDVGRREARRLARLLGGEALERAGRAGGRGAEAAGRLEDVLAGLTERQRAALVLVRLWGMSRAEAALEMGVSEADVARALAEATREARSKCD